MEIRDIKKIVELMNANDLTEFSIKDAEFELSMRRGSTAVPVVHTAPVAVAATAPVTAPAVTDAVAPAAVENADDGLVEIPSPIVGTFYRKPAPDADDFVQVGSEVGPDTVVCIVEAMKVMNEIKADVKGVIKKILVDDAAAVQYGQPLFLVEPK